MLAATGWRKHSIRGALMAPRLPDPNGGQGTFAALYG